MTADVPASEPHMLYHMPMARKEVLVQLDDELVRRLDALAAKAGISRSELLRRGAIAVLEASELAEADQALMDPAPAGRLDEVTRARLDRALRYALDIRY